MRCGHRFLTCWLGILLHSSTLTLTAANAVSEDSLLLKLVDSQGQAVAGANIGTKVDYGEGRVWWTVGRENTPFASDDEGRVRLDGSRIFPSSYADNRTVPIYAFHAEYDLVGLRQFCRAELGREFEIKLVRPCRVYGGIDSSELRSLGYELTSKNVWVRSVASRDEFLVYRYNRHRDDKDQFEFFLPPGQYEFRVTVTGNVQGAHSGPHERTVTVEPDRRGLDLGALDAPAYPLAALIGKPAPELEGIRQWKNSGPLTLADLRGKVVLLHFWIYFCDRVDPQMHNLINLYKEVRRRDLDLEVIVVHDGRFETIEEMEAAFDADPNLLKVRRERWAGKNLAFPIALDTREPARHLGANTYLRGINWANYKVTSYPRTLLIDRNGILVGSFSFAHPYSALTKLQPYLAVGVGTRIDDLKEFSLNLSAESLADKRILLCFFDWRQRPSRHCLARLNERAQELAAQNVVVLAVDAAGPERGDADDYVEEQKITVPVGTVGSDVDEVRHAWNVQSLPWLVLTDCQHVVTALGFSLAELDEQLDRTAVD